MILFVVNENSGNGRGKKIWTKVEVQLRDRGTEYLKVAAGSEKESIAQIDEILNRGKMKAIAVVGGDGTLHSLLPLLAGSGIPYGIIPSGSGNDTARALGIPRNPLRALDLIVAGKTRSIDLLETITADGVRQLTLTAVAIGLDATVAADVNGSRYKRWCNKLGVGSLSYVIGLFRALRTFSPQVLTVTIDGALHTFPCGWLSAVANVSTYGGGLKICPNALPDDGQLHVCVVSNCSVWRILLLFPTLLNGTHIKQRYVTILSGSQVKIEAPSKLLAFGDGEPSGQAPITATIRPRQLVFLVAASG